MEKTVVKMEKTRREQVLAELEEGDRSIRELAELCETTPREITTDLEHIQRSLKGRGKKLYVLPPRCKSCGKKVKTSKIKDISRCPECKSTYLLPKRFKIK